MNEANTPRRGATGMHTADGMPHGFTSLTPFLALEGAAEAVRFYETVFGARVVDVTEIGGVVVHAELDFGSGRLQIGEPTSAFALIPAPQGDAACYSIGLYCADADAVVEAAARGGAVVREPVRTFVSGDRFGSIRDPFGVRWTIMSRVEDLSESESIRRVTEWAAQQQASTGP